MLAIIGGSGLTQLSNLEVSRREVVRTPYGEPSGILSFGQIGGKSAVFLARHGHGHTIPPHRVNYRANLWALRECGASRVVSVASVGCIRKGLSPGELVIPNQILDYTWGRAHTFFDGDGAPVTHTDFTEPYDAALRNILIKAAAAANIPLRDGAVYAATQGPRLETAAEIDRLERDGAEIVGMTGMPEASLARELGLPYASIALIVNHAAGRGDSARGIHFGQLETVLHSATDKVRTILSLARTPDRNLEK
ncbi:MAG: S-methyl-5'-thioinosine phosphorylase [Zoogloeaceae bacterium]|jgi:5'-methylthioadenosine phosphorylase|nr:S-methyl-5'-thioinosine phosphorylase [Zoogloeaceae bacterium]